MLKVIFTDWLTKWDNELYYDVFLLANNYTTHAVTVKFKHEDRIFIYEH